MNVEKAFIYSNQGMIMCKTLGNVSVEALEEFLDNTINSISAGNLAYWDWIADWRVKNTHAGWMGLKDMSGNVKVESVWVVEKDASVSKYMSDYA